MMTIVNRLQLRNTFTHGFASRNLFLQHMRRTTTTLSVRSSNFALSQCFHTASLSASNDNQNTQKEKETLSYFTQKWDFFLRLLGYYGSESTIIRQSARMVQSGEFQASRQGFSRLFDIEPDDIENKKLGFHQRQQLYMLHMWMLHHRLLKEGEIGKTVQESMFDAFWENTTRRIRATGIHELTLNKHLAEVQKWSFGAAVSYDHAIAVTDDKDHELGSAIWRNVFAGDPTVEEKRVYNLAMYVRKQVKELEDLDRNNLMNGDIRWVNPPYHKPEDDEISLWQPALAVDGRTYWWNIKTRETSWDKPIHIKTMSTEGN